MSSLKHINHVTALVKNKILTEKFYTEMLGLESVRRGNSIWIKIGDQFIHVTENHGAPACNFSHFSIGVENVTAYLKTLAVKGVDVFDIDDQMNKVTVNGDWDKPNRQFFIEDPDGNFIEFNDVKNSFFYE